MFDISSDLEHMHFLSIGVSKTTDHLLTAYLSVSPMYCNQTQFYCKFWLHLLDMNPLHCIQPISTVKWSVWWFLFYVKGWHQPRCWRVWRLARTKLTRSFPSSDTRSVYCRLLQVTKHACTHTHSNAYTHTPIHTLILIDAHIHTLHTHMHACANPVPHTGTEGCGTVRPWPLAISPFPWFNPTPT